jgi:hypothetical protein
MSIIKTLRNGAVAAVSSYRLTAVIWSATLILALAVGYPLKVFLNSGLGKSMAAERLMQGFDLGLAGDMGKPFGALVSSASAGTILFGIIGFFLMVFFTGGLFRRFTLAWGNLKVSEFLQASAVSFVPFLKITVLMLLIIAGYTLIIAGLPVILAGILSGSGMPSRAAIFIIAAIWALGMPVWLVVADASRRWASATGSAKVFSALGAGFRALREKFWLSYSAVLAVVVLNAVFMTALLWFAATATPEKGYTVFLFFIATQALIFLRLLLKAWRYAVVCETAK